MGFPGGRAKSHIVGWVHDSLRVELSVGSSVRGVPIVAKLLYVEQKLNRVVTVEGMNLPLPVKESKGRRVHESR